MGVGCDWDVICPAPIDKPVSSGVYQSESVQPIQPSIHQSDTDKDVRIIWSTGEIRQHRKGARFASNINDS